MEELSEKQKQLRSKVTWSLVEKFTEEMIAKGVNLGELKQIVTFLVVMNSVNTLKGDDKKVLSYIEKVYNSMLELHHLHFYIQKPFSHEKNNTGIVS